MILSQCARCKRESPRQEAFRKVKIRGRLQLRCPVCWRKYQQTQERDGLLFALGLPTVLAILSGFWIPELGWLFLNLAVAVLMKIALIVPHELGHALAARLLGMRVYSISVGVGKTLWSRQWQSVNLVLRAIPSGGLTTLGFPSLRWLRSRYVLTLLAGPAVNAVLAAAVLVTIPLAEIYPLGGQGPFHTPIDDMFPVGEVGPFRELIRDGLPRTILPAADFLLANLFMLVLNLCPHMFRQEGRTVKSDGLAILTSPFLSAAACKQLHAGYFSLEGQHCSSEARYEDALHCHRRGLAHYPDDPINAYSLGLALLHANRFAEARYCWKALLERPGLLPGLRSLLTDAVAMVDFLLASPVAPTASELPTKEELLREADACSRRVFQDAPWDPSLRGTRGCVLVVRGEMEEGVKLLREAMQEETSLANQAYCACYLALAEAKKGRGEECRRLLETARKLDPHCVALPLVTQEAAALLQAAVV